MIKVTKLSGKRRKYNLNGKKKKSKRKSSGKNQILQIKHYTLE